ncbi:MAG: hypothetical protein AB7K04_11795 [Pseudorhodoplanes sp.]
MTATTDMMGGHDSGTIAGVDPLVAATMIDPGAPFQREALERLAMTRQLDRAAFESLRAALKSVGCRVGQLDQALAELIGEGRPRRPTQGDALISVAAEADLFHAPDGSAFADVTVAGHRETLKIRGREFRRWLTREYFEQTGSAPSSEALLTALNVIEARAHFDAPERDVNVRVAGADGAIYLDLGTDDWTAVRTVADGWDLVDRAPVRFYRSAGMQPLPIPERGGSVLQLRRFLNVTDGSFCLIVAWLVAALRDYGPYPVLGLIGEQGTAKTTASKIIRACVDPNVAPVRTLPREDRDLFIAARNGHILGFDNISGLQPWIADALCQLATGTGFASRELYSDTAETIIDACKPIVLNGIEDVTNRPDLADRSLILTLEPIPDAERRIERELWTEFQAERPRILGALLDAVAHGLRELPTTRLERLPRMADFAVWATACEGAHSTTGNFLSAYTHNRDAAADDVVDADQVAAAIRSAMVSRTVWTQTAASLLGALSEQVGDKQSKDKGWPSSARALSGRLRRAAPALRRVGVEITFEREGRARTRTITISRSEGGGVQPSAPSVPSAQAEFFEDGSES